jgi:hypothetical protein
LFLFSVAITTGIRNKSSLSGRRVRSGAIKGRKPSGNLGKSPGKGMIVDGRQGYQIRKFPDLDITSNVSTTVMAKTLSAAKDFHPHARTKFTGS